MAFSLPYTLTAGTPENVNNVQSNFGAAKDEFNQVTTTGQLSVDAAASASTYKLIHALSANGAASLSAATYVPPNGTWTASNSTNTGAGVVYLDPADFTVSGRTTYYRVRAALLTNATAPAVSFTVGLYPVSAAAGGAGVLTLTLGTVTSGSTVAFTTQAASTRGQGNSGDFAAPTAGFYAIGVSVSGSQAANSIVGLVAQLQARQI